MRFGVSRTTIAAAVVALTLAAPAAPSLPSAHAADPAASTSSAGPSSVAPASASATPSVTPAEATELPDVCHQQKTIICVSKAEHRLRYFEAGAEWLSARVAFGRPGYETPTGTWTVATKAPDQWWSYPFKVYMPWGMKFDTGIGLYVHYSSGFAQNPDGYIGSHGCVQLGDWETARRLYQRVPVGTTVHIY